MNRPFSAAATAAMVTIALVSAEAAHALRFTVEPAGVTTQTSWVGRPTTVINFSNVSNGAVPTSATTIATSGVNGNATIQRSSDNDAAVFKDSPVLFDGGGRYLEVGSTSNNQNGTGAVRLSFDAARGLGYFGFFWGSPTTTDAITLTLRNAVGVTNTVTYTAAQIFAGLDFNLNNNSNSQGRYVNFFATSQGADANKVITSVLLSDTSNNRSFEIDNVAYQAIPTPALLPGLAAMGLGLLRKRKAEADA